MKKMIIILALCYAETVFAGISGMINITNNTPYDLHMDMKPMSYEMTRFDFPQRIAKNTFTNLANLTFKYCDFEEGFICRDASGFVKYTVHCEINGVPRKDEFEIHATVPNQEGKYFPHVYAYQADPNPYCVKVEPNSVSTYFSGPEKSALANILVSPVTP